MTPLVTKPDSFPLDDWMDDCSYQVRSTKFVRRFDLLKVFCNTNRSLLLWCDAFWAYTFQHLINRVIGDLQGCAVFLDDGVVYSETWETHLACIWELFTCFEGRGSWLTMQSVRCKGDHDLPWPSVGARPSVSCGCKSSGCRTVSSTPKIGVPTVFHMQI